MTHLEQDSIKYFLFFKIIHNYVCIKIITVSLLTLPKNICLTSTLHFKTSNFISLSNSIPLIKLLFPLSTIPFPPLHPFPPPPPPPPTSSVSPSHAYCFFLLLCPISFLLLLSLHPVISFIGHTQTIEASFCNLFNKMDASISTFFRSPN